MINLENQGDRKLIIQEIEGPENKARKATSLRQFEIFNDRQHQYVLEYLRTQFAEKTVKEMPVISSINLARRICKQEASLYKDAPVRTFEGVTPEKQEALEKLYAESGVNDKMQSANEYYKLQNQVHIQWVLKYGKLVPRVLLGHHLDVIPDPEDPEKGMVYIISTFDKRNYIFNEYTSPTGYNGRSNYLGLPSDGFNQAIGDRDDYQSKLKRYVVWSKDYNFIMDKDGNILSEDIVNPIGIIPIVDVSSSKDFEYWQRQGQSVSDFSIQFNGMLSDVANVVRLQGWGQAVYKGPEGMIPESLQIGPNHVLRMPIDPANPVDTDFSYVTASPDIEGSLNWLKMQLSMFMSSRGVDPSTVSFSGESKTFTSGLDRLLAMVQKFEASKQDLDLFTKAEKQSFEIIKAYVNAYDGTELLQAGIGELPEGSTMQISFTEPQMIQTEMERLDTIIKKKSAGLISDVRAYMEFYGVSEETAVKELAEINGSGLGLGLSIDAGSDEMIKGAAVGNQTKVADTALNGAQVTSMVDVVTKYNQGLISGESAAQILSKAFLISVDEAKKIVGQKMEIPLDGQTQRADVI